MISIKSSSRSCPARAARPSRPSINPRYNRSPTIYTSSRIGNDAGTHRLPRRVLPQQPARGQPPALATQRAPQHPDLGHGQNPPRRRRIDTATAATEARMSTNVAVRSWMDRCYRDHPRHEMGTRMERRVRMNYDRDPYLPPYAGHVAFEVGLPDQCEVWVVDRLLTGKFSCS